MTEYIKERFII